MMKKKDFNIIKKHITISSLAIAMAASPLAVPTAQASAGLDGITGVVNVAVGMSQIYSVYLDSLFTQGNSPVNHDSLFKDDMKTKEANPNSDDVALVDEIMNPLLWGVNL